MADGILSPVAGSPSLSHPATHANVDLRPLTTGELIDRGFSLYRAHFAAFLLLALLCQTAPLMEQVLATALKLNVTPTQIQHATGAAFTKVGLNILLFVIAHIIVFGFEMVLTFYIADAYLGRNPSVRESMYKFAKRIATSFWTCLLNMLLIVSTLLFPILAVAASRLYAQFYPPENLVSLLLFSGATFLLLIASLVPVLIVFMRVILVIPALALENFSGWKAIKRSSDLVRYDPGLGFFYWGEMRLSFLLLPLFIIELLILSVTSLPLVIFKISEAVRDGFGAELAQPPDSTMIISQIMTFLGTSLILPLYPIAATLFYYDIRIRREGYDLEILAEQLEARP